MLIINNNTTNSYFNIAAEEFLLKETKEDIFMLYVDEPSVIVGKHQNTLAEINYRFICENNISVVRRISGGGTVYHDGGNLNFSFIANGSEGHLVDFKRFTQPIIEVLQEKGIDARLEGKNDIRVSGLKISGNAEHVFKNRVLHHGTILVISDVSKLSSSLKVETGKYEDNAVKSIRSKVSNINNFTKEFIQVNYLKEQIFAKIKSLSECEMYEFTHNDIQNIENLANEKFRKWNWNFAYSPKYIFRNNGIYLDTPFHVYLEVENGIIQNAKISGIELIENLIVGIQHNIESVRKIFQNHENSNEMAWLFF